VAKTVLQVEQSLQLARWVFPAADPDAVERLARRHGLPEIVARLLHARQVPEEGVESFLNPKLKTDFPDPMKLAGMAELAPWLAEAIQNKRGIGVFGDFDVDGATSTAIMVRFLRHFGIEPPLHIPDRLAEGYGPNVNALRKLKERGAEIVIICDCGTTAFDVIKEGRALGLDLVILDHHEAEEALPEANHVINPKRRDDTSGYTMLAACGVTFLACVAVNAALRALGAGEAPLKDWLDIVALGTVCDMVPLKGPNRLMVRHGFAQMAKTSNPGLRALLEVSGVKTAPDPYHAGFILGPRINAGSRVHQADLGARLLCTDDAAEARDIAWMLDDCNEKRKELQAEMFDHAIGMVEAQGLHEKPLILVGHEDWHPGLAGLVAGRLKEKYDRPAIVVTYTVGESSKLEGRGSARSVPGINMGAAFIDARNEGLLIKGGGHAMAAGFTLDPARFDDFAAFLERNVASQLGGAPRSSDAMVDGLLSVRGAQPDFVRLIRDHFGPFGQENPEPVFVLANVRLHMVDVIGADHIRAQVSDWEGGPRLKAVAFRAKDTPLGQAMLRHGSNRPFHLAGTLKLDTWNGQERVELHIQDAALALGTEAGAADDLRVAG
jgi:single-stranded-DNA-specific exonuclease